MKYLILHAQGFADVPKSDLDGRTPLEAAGTPNMDRLAGEGELGVAILPTDGPQGGADVVPVALLGYDPKKVYPGPAPFEAIGLGIAVGEQDVVYRCNLVTLRSGNKKPRDLKKLLPTAVMEEAAVCLDVEDARECIDAINEQLGSETIQFYPGPGDRHFMVWVNGKAKTTCVNPEEILNRTIGEALPSGDGADILRKLMDASIVILSSHPINDQREEAGLKPINAMWLWGQGRSPHLTPLTEERQITGSVTAMSALHRGVAMAAGLEGIDVAAEAEPLDFRTQAEVAVRELGKKDLVYVHSAVTNANAQRDDGKAKVSAIEDYDRHLVGPLLQAASQKGHHRVLLVCDGFIVDVKPPVVPLMPYAFYDSAGRSTSGANRFSAAAHTAQAGARDATKLMARLMPRTA